MILGPPFSLRVERVQASEHPLARLHAAERRKSDVASRGHRACGCALQVHGLRLGLVRGLLLALPSCERYTTPRAAQIPEGMLHVPRVNWALRDGVLVPVSSLLAHHKMYIPATRTRRPSCLTLSLVSNQRLQSLSRSRLSASLFPPLDPLRASLKSVHRRKLVHGNPPLPRSVAMSTTAVEDVQGGRHIFDADRSGAAYSRVLR